MAPSATSTTATLQEQPAAVLKNVGAAQQTEPEEMECKLSEMSRGPNAITGTRSRILLIGP